ncbi:MAG: outer membrane beta-barrel protein [Candidatus Eiseniibacteriota bacterium]
MKRNHGITLLGLVVALVLATPAVSHAFGLLGVGGKVGMVDPEGGDGAPAVSAHLEFYQPGSSWNWHMMPSVMLWDSDQLTSVSGNFDMYYHFMPSRSATPYAGAGVGVHHYDFDGPGDTSTRLGLNLFGGLRFPTWHSHMFLEGRYTSSRISQIGLMGGVTFIGGR